MNKINLYNLMRGISISVMACAILFISVMQIHDYRHYKIIQKELNLLKVQLKKIKEKDLKDLTVPLNKILEWQTIIQIKGIDEGIVDNTSVKIKDYPLNNSFINNKYKISDKCILNEHVIGNELCETKYAWPILTAAQGIMSCDHDERADDISKMISALLKIIDKNTEKSGDKYYFLCGDLYMGERLKGPNKSAFSNATIIAALHMLYQKTHEVALLDLAQKYVDAIAIDENRLIFIDKTEYLWLEEAIHPDPKQHFGILNGHVWAAFVLFEHWKITKDPRLLTICKAAILTCERYIFAMRRPGKLISYAASNLPDVGDYGPLRAIRQMEELARLSNEPRFSDFADLLRTDQPFLHKGKYNGNTDLPCE